MKVRTPALHGAVDHDCTAVRTGAWSIVVVRAIRAEHVVLCLAELDGDRAVIDHHDRRARDHVVMIDVKGPARHAAPSIERRSKDIPGQWAERARIIAVQEIAPALDRQLGELRASAPSPRRSGNLGTSARRRISWALKASTTTSLSPDEVHEMGQSEVRRLHAQMDTILKEIGYSRAAWANG